MTRCYILIYIYIMPCPKVQTKSSEKNVVPIYIIITIIILIMMMRYSFCPIRLHLEMCVCDLWLWPHFEVAEVSMCCLLCACVTSWTLPQLWIVSIYVNRFIVQKNAKFCHLYILCKYSTKKWLMARSRQIITFFYRIVFLTHLWFLQFVTNI